MVLRFCGFIVLLFMVLGFEWFHGFMVVWFYGCMVLCFRFYGFIVLWFYGLCFQKSTKFQFHVFPQDIDPMAQILHISLQDFLSFPGTRLFQI